MRHGQNRSLRPLELRMKLFQAVKKRRAEGMSHKAIIRAVEEEFHVRLSKSHVSYWIRGTHVPDGSVRGFVPVPSTPLGYVTGVMLGDGSTSASGDHNYRLKLRVRDRDFAEAFSNAVGFLLNRSPPRVKFHAKTKAWHVEVSGLLLFNFLRQPIAQLRPVIQGNEACVRGFLMGFFDSEGNISGRRLTVCNGDLQLLSFAADLLKTLDIGFTGPILTKEGGGKVVIRGKTWNCNLNQYIVRVSSKSLEKFQEKVGFCIKRKSDSLALAILTGPGLMRSKARKRL